MTNIKSSLRFDHREIAVIFSLFIFVSLLMFTVGILVGKGLSQAKYEASGGWEKRGLNSLHNTTAPAAAGHGDSIPVHQSMGSSVTTPEPVEEKAPEQAEHGDGHGAAGHAKATALKPPAKAPAKEEGGHDYESSQKPEEIELIPLNSPMGEGASGAAFVEPTHSKEAEALLKDPKIRNLVENDPAPLGGKGHDRSPNSLSTPPPSAAEGRYTVQVGAYLNEEDAAHRVEGLKKMGFAHAFFSVKEMGENNQTWYRVWLGYFADQKTAKLGGDYLQKRKEVKDYLVRKSEAAN